MGQVDVQHPETGEVSQVQLPDDHDGSRVKVEFPDGEIGFTEGWDPAEVAIAAPRPEVRCPNCGELQVLTASKFECSACGARNEIELRTSGDTARSAELAP